MGIKELNKEIKSFYSKLDFHCDKIEDDTIFIATRENGCTLNEEPSDEDWDNAIKIEQFVEDLCDRRGLEAYCNTYTVDEWTQIDIVLL